MLIIDLNDRILRKKRSEELFRLVEWQTGFGRRYPGSEEHKLFIKELYEKLSSLPPKVIKQEFTISLENKEVECINLIATMPKAPICPEGTAIPKAPICPEGAAIPSENKERPILLGTHFDTRLIADNETDPELKNKPILGANDGGSGTAVLLHLLELIKHIKFTKDIVIALFDAEDVGNMDGNPFSVGARYYADNPVPCLPEEVLILDMVGGKNFILDVDAHVFNYINSFNFTKKIFKIAYDNKLIPFTTVKQNKYKYIICDHTPFMLKQIPTCILIDIDYPEWHTQKDTPDAMSGESLVIIEDLVIKYLEEYVED